MNRKQRIGAEIRRNMAMISLVKSRIPPRSHKGSRGDVRQVAGESPSVHFDTQLPSLFGILFANWHRDYRSSAPEIQETSGGRTDALPEYAAIMSVTQSSHK